MGWTETPNRAVFDDKCRRSVLGKLSFYWHCGRGRPAWMPPPGLLAALHLGYAEGAASRNRIQCHGGPPGKSSGLAAGGNPDAGTG